MTNHAGKNFGNPWVLAARPKTLPAGAGPVILGLALASSHLKGQAKFDILVAITTLITTLLLQISSNLINDYYDGVSGLDGEDRLGPPRAVSLGLLPAATVKKAFLLTLSLAFLLGVFLMVKGGLPIIIIGLSSIFFSWAYTGGPFPLSYFGLGEVAAFIFFGPIAVYGTYYLQTNIALSAIPNAVWLMGCGVGLISSALMGVNNLRDTHNDKREGKTTLSTLLGTQVMRKLIVCFLISSQIFGFFVIKDISELSILIGLIPMALFYATWWKILGSTSGKELNNVLARVGQYLFLYSIFYSGILLWHRL